MIPIKLLYFILHMCIRDMHFTKSNTSCNEISFNSNYSTNITLHEKKNGFYSGNKNYPKYLY